MTICSKRAHQSIRTQALLRNYVPGPVPRVSHVRTHNSHHNLWGRSSISSDTPGCRGTERPRALPKVTQPGNIQENVSFHTSSLHSHGRGRLCKLGGSREARKHPAFSSPTSCLLFVSSGFMTLCYQLNGLKPQGSPCPLAGMGRESRGEAGSLTGLPRAHVRDRWSHPRPSLTRTAGRILFLVAVGLRSHFLAGC